MQNTRPKVAVIGAGIFGVNTAIDASNIADVTLYEQQADILCDGSFVNQFRHHMGYHYPRSAETVVDIQESARVFEDRYSRALVTSTPTYYGIAKEGSNVTADEFLAFCDKHNLPYKKEKPADGYFNEDLLALIIRVPEPSYHYETLRKLIHDLIKEREDKITAKFNRKVVNCRVEGGKKILSSIDSNGQVFEDEYDFVVNATYAHLNDFTNWLGLKPFPVRVDLAEVLIVKIPGPQQSLTVMDGPFATIMPTGNPNEYTLYHAQHSILDRYTPEDGLVKVVSKPTSNKEEIFSQGKILFPFLKDAELVESRVAHRGVLANHEHDDSRVADIVVHGSGCWSVLSGKILSSVRTSQRVTEMIKNSLV